MITSLESIIVLAIAVTVSISLIAISKKARPKRTESQEDDFWQSEDYWKNKLDEATEKENSFKRYAEDHLKKSENVVAVKSKAPKKTEKKTKSPVKKMNAKTKKSIKNEVH